MPFGSGLRNLRSQLASFNAQGGAAGLTFQPAIEGIQDELGFVQGQGLEELLLSLASRTAPTADTLTRVGRIGGLSAGVARTIGGEQAQALQGRATQQALTALPQIRLGAAQNLLGQQAGALGQLGEFIQLGEFERQRRKDQLLNSLLGAGSSALGAYAAGARQPAQAGLGGTTFSGGGLTTGGYVGGQTGFGIPVFTPQGR